MLPQFLLLSLQFYLSSITCHHNSCYCHNLFLLIISIIFLVVIAIAKNVILCGELQIVAIVTKIVVALEISFDNPMVLNFFFRQHKRITLHVYI